MYFSDIDLSSTQLYQKMFTSKAIRGAHYILAQVELFLIDLFHDQLNNPFLHPPPDFRLEMH